MLVVLLVLLVLLVVVLLLLVLLVLVLVVRVVVPLRLQVPSSAHRIHHCLPVTRPASCHRWTWALVGRRPTTWNARTSRSSERRRCWVRVA